MSAFGGLHQSLAEGKGVTVKWGLEEAGSKPVTWGTRSAWEARPTGRVGTRQRSPMQPRVGRV